MSESLADLYRQIFLFAPIGFAISDETGHVVDANDGLLRLGGYVRGDLMGKTAADFYYDGAAVREHAVAEMRRRGSLDRYELKFRKKGGSFFWAHMTLRPFPHEGRRYIIAMIEDVTELKKAREDRERHVRELEQLMRTLVGREQRMIELKEKVQALEKKLDQGHEDDAETP